MINVVARCVLLLSMLPASFAAAKGSTTAPTTAPAPRVLIVSMDGCRPDMLLRAEAPHVRQLMKEGAFSFWARTTPLAITLPSHTSMLTGVIPRKHEVEWNKDLPFAHPVYPSFPTLFEVAHQRGYTTAMAAGKSKFSVLAKPGTLDWSYITASEKSDDSDVADHAIEMLREHQPQVMFVHFPSTDNVGHAVGWGTAEQLATIEDADQNLGRILSALDLLGLKRSTTIIVTADHGGAGRTHLPDDARARHIPWIAVGPGIKHNVDLTTYAELVINTEDTFATASHVLRLPLDKQLDGKVVREAFEVTGELMTTTGR